MRRMFTAVIYVLVNGCAWRSLPPWLRHLEVDGPSAVLDLVESRRLGAVCMRTSCTVSTTPDSSTLPDSPDSAHVRAQKGANTQFRVPGTGANRVPGPFCRTRTDRLSSSGPRPPTSTTALR